MAADNSAQAPEEISTASSEPIQSPTDDQAFSTSPKLQFKQRFESLLPQIQKEWPEVARHTLEATRGSYDHVAELLSHQTGDALTVVKDKLSHLQKASSDQAQHLSEAVKPLEEQLDQLLDELNSTLRPKIEKPVKERPLFALAVAAGVGVIAGLLLANGRRSS